MTELIEDDFEVLDRCSWDETSAELAKFLYLDDMDCDVVRCPQCGVVYAKRRLNAKALPKYWGDYLSRVHTHDIDAVEKRNKMYQIDYEFSSRYVSAGRDLNVGCCNGSFMDVYESHDYEVFGVDFGEEKFDLIIFRGVLQYVPYPKEYLKKAVRLLKPKRNFHAGGHLFITAQPYRKCAERISSFSGLHKKGERYTFT